MKEDLKRPPQGEERLAYGGAPDSKEKYGNFDKKFEEKVVRQIWEKFLKLQSERRLIERGWELNMNFLSGNQYCDIGPTGELEEEEPRFYWQYRRVFNHIAPAIYNYLNGSCSDYANPFERMERKRAALYSTPPMYYE